MIICPNCQHENTNGSVFCAECGEQLDGVETLVTQAITEDQISEDLRNQAPRPEAEVTPANSWLSLHLMDSGKIMPLASRNEFTLGRLSEMLTHASSMIAENLPAGMWVRPSSSISQSWTKISDQASGLAPQSSAENCPAFTSVT